MDVAAELVAPCSPETLFAWVDDLGRYPRWLDIVVRATPVDGHPADVGPAWSVDLRGRFGRLARSKRLRMVRVLYEPPHRVRFERAELDGRHHARWTLSASVTPAAPDGDDEGTSAAGSMLRMRLHYGGSLLDPVVERLLAEEIRRSKPRLLAALDTSLPT